MRPYKFSERAAGMHSTVEASKQLKVALLTAHDEIKFGFFSGHTSNLTHLPRTQKRQSYVYGVTQPCPHSADITKVWISVEMLQPLLRDDLNPAER
jgi:hypothetical protein